ncbi:ubiquinone anaerobic biosynthesis protein UbiU [Marinospirillum insulare]|uniref:Ubiquinone biosynthesis protein UbiU n=1 Tax=Marinospirillum insulare TaxID=217169 RepID=A0ABQ5ZX19_9GAMM|nr:peptidase U32 family protein [Marinospirillum insulare]GLR64016.1 hypothetical protein GCM10007878_14540 [Marinospirillum insulare]
MELVCPAGSLPALKVAVDQGANAVYLGFRNSTNARQFAGLNFSEKKAAEGIHYAHSRGCKVYCAINTYPQPAGWNEWTRAVDQAANLGVDALILADIGLLDYATHKHPSVNRHLSVQGSATTAAALQFHADNFGIKRAVLPRVLSAAQVADLVKSSPVELEVFGFGSLCIMVEGRCYLSSYLTDESPNSKGACSPAKAVRWEDTPKGLESRLNGTLIDRYQKDENAGYPTLCKGRFNVGEATYHALEEPTSLNTLNLLPQLKKMGIAAIKLEGRQRSPAYVKQIVEVWRQALDALEEQQDDFKLATPWQKTLSSLSEGSSTTLGAYHRRWK